SVEIVIEADVRCSFRTQSVFGNRVNLVTKTVGEGQFFIDLPGVPCVELGLIVAITANAASAVRKDCTRIVVVVVAGDGTYTTQTEGEGAIETSNGSRTGVDIGWTQGRSQSGDKAAES